MPTPMPATKATGRLTIAADEGGQEGQQEQVGAEDLGEGTGLAGRGQHGGDGRQGAGQVQATVEVRRTQIPDKRADSAFSAMARMARPHDEKRMKAARAGPRWGPRSR